jgi:hypothetical protein
MRERERLLKRLAEVRESIPYYFGSYPSGDGAQDCFDREFDQLMQEEEEIMSELRLHKEGEI